MLGKKPRRFDLRSFLMAFETPPVDPEGGGGGGTDPVTPPVVPPADPAKPDPEKPTDVALPDDVKAKLAELDKLKADKTKAEKIAAEKAKAEADAKRTTEEQLAESHKEIASLKQRQVVRDVRDELGMTGAIYNRLAATVTETDEDAIKETLTAIKAEVDAYVSAEVEKTKGVRAPSSNGSPTGTKPAKPEKSAGLFQTLFNGN